MLRPLAIGVRPLEEDLLKWLPEICGCSDLIVEIQSLPYLTASHWLLLYHNVRSLTKSRWPTVPTGRPLSLIGTLSPEADGNLKSRIVASA
jgi:hypothetical protein